MERPLSWPHIQLSTKSGAPLSERLIWSPTIERSQTLTRKCQCRRSSSTTHWKMVTDLALLLVGSRPTPNYSTRLPGRRRKILTLTLLELSTGTDIIKQNLSTSHAYLTQVEGWRSSTKHMIFRMSTQRSTGSPELLRPKSTLQDRAPSTRGNSTSRCEHTNNSFISLNTLIDGLLF